jgi:hypothetical protein
VTPATTATAITATNGQGELGLVVGPPARGATINRPCDAQNQKG